MRMLVFAKQQTGGSQDYLVCHHPLTILKDQSHISKVLLTLGIFPVILENSQSKRMDGQFEFNFAEAFNYDHCLMQNLITAFYDRAVGVRCAGA